MAVPSPIAASPRRTEPDSVWKDKDVRKQWCMVLYDRAKELTEFCLEHGGKAFQGYQVPVLFQYAFFHLGDRTAFVVRKGEISAAMFCWGAPELEIRGRAESGQSTFQWRTSNDQAGSLFVAEVVKRPDCNAKTLAKLFRQAMSRWPDWQQKKIFTFRNGFLVELEPSAIARLMNEGNVRGYKEATHGR